MTNLVEHATRELSLCGQTHSDPAYAAAIVAAVEAFTSFGHSGSSAELATQQLSRLLRRETLAPLTPRPEEWEDRSEMSGAPLWQNVRDPRAFSDNGGQTWWYVSGRHPGERCKDGGEMGILVRCRECSGSGVLHKPQVAPHLMPVPSEGRR